MSIQRTKWYNDVIFVVSDGWIVGWKNRSVLVELAKPFLTNTIHKGMMKSEDGVVWRWRYIPNSSTHDYVNLVMWGGDIWQTISGLCTDVALQDVFKIAAWLFAIGWQVKCFKPRAKLTSSLVGNVIVYPCFLTLSSFSFSVIRSKPGFMFVESHIFIREYNRFVHCSRVRFFFGAQSLP